MDQQDKGTWGGSTGICREEHEDGSASWEAEEHVEQRDMWRDLQIRNTEEGLVEYVPM